MSYRGRGYSKVPGLTGLRSWHIKKNTLCCLYLFAPGTKVCWTDFQFVKFFNVYILTLKYAISFIVLRSFATTRTGQSSLIKSKMIGFLYSHLIGYWQRCFSNSNLCQGKLFFSVIKRDSCSEKKKKKNLPDLPSKKKKGHKNGTERSRTYHV